MSSQPASFRSCALIDPRTSRSVASLTRAACSRELGCGRYTPAHGSANPRVAVGVGEGSESREPRSTGGSDVTARRCLPKQASRARQARGGGGSQLRAARSPPRFYCPLSGTALPYRRPARIHRTNVTSRAPWTVRRPSRACRGAGTPGQAHSRPRAESSGAGGFIPWSLAPVRQAAPARPAGAGSRWVVRRAVR